MDSLRFSLRPFVRLVVCASLCILGLAVSVHAGLLGGGNQRAVGGVIIDGSGIVRDANVEEKRELAEMLRAQMDAIGGDLQQADEMRMISLSGLQNAITAAAGKPLPAEIAFLAGLQRVEYVLVDSENNDIVIGGPAEPWTVREDGSVVGAVSGHPTMRLADLAVAMRGLEQASAEGISCSIEPTPEGRRKLQQLLRGVKLRPGQNPAAMEESMKLAFGPQMIHLTGVPTDSRYARTMVAADFEMKRVAMGLTRSGVDDLPSYIAMSRNAAHGAGQNPRWWMACDYEELTRSEDGMAWKMSGNRIKTMTEQDLIDQNGAAKGSGKQDKLAQAWADRMNSNLDKLSVQMPIFGELQNVMDMTVLATLIRQEGLAQKAGLDLSVLKGDDSPVKLASYEVPRSVAPQCSFIRGRKGWIVTASGGVDINAFEVVEKQRVDDSISEKTDAKLASKSDRWWWN
ncbi:hypothetical protein LF1_09970 [Rubripirellula obstinata]|uniref:DUF1598 domain-containing protein n=1 Tax=Rubripirellula obstinata TaxID=406547 RepID=A0A5B1CBJ7_9BACT|nr:DUF1598 domain-containing protein [Rubripirellula obstinata]KAA1258477.1 hypothetical protein LF1_09970 [Rubripirellula obstinata]